ncbi:hypothetical protein [Sulfurimonas diazotrophicus]|uniref:Porin n=1 Tax=Sulfurimonas diazotrophicus TaxID=3131939 RepID=A0ABZ3HA62_9BACT
MKQIVFTTIIALLLGTAAANATQFYVDGKGQVFTEPAEDRTALETDTPVFAKSSKLEFSGLHYLGYTYEDKKALPEDNLEELQTGNFEFRRNYIQVKAFFFDDPKSYLRVTLDTTYDATNSSTGGYANMYVKYAYIYLNNILPYTGVEFGMAHRPWIDYEEHNGWWYRSISKTMVESAQAADLTNSADAGINFKTKLPYFTSEIGLFNGEGYHGTQGNNDKIGTGNSIEWRLTAAALGDGDVKRKATKNTYLDLSFFGQYNMLNDGNEMNGTAQTYAFYGFHTVYNMPSLLLSAQYVIAENNNDTTYKKSGSGFSVNGTYRFGDAYEFEVLARYDNWTAKMDNNPDLNTENYIYGAAWRQNKNLKWLLTGETYVANDKKNYAGSYTQDFTAAMLTAEVSW